MPGRRSSLLPYALDRSWTDPLALAGRYPGAAPALRYCPTHDAVLPALSDHGRRGAAADGGAPFPASAASVEVHSQLKNEADVALRIAQVHRDADADCERAARVDPLHTGDGVVAEFAVLAPFEAQGEVLNRPDQRAAKAAFVVVEGAQRLERPVAEIEAHG